MLISLVEWAKKNGITDSAARQKAISGTIPAQKIGRNWVIDDSIPNTDNRIKSGKYIGLERKR